MISRRILAAVALLCVLSCAAHAQPYTKAQLNAQVSANLPDNTSFQILPSNVRTVTDNIINSILPTAPVVSGNLACFNGTTGLLQDCGTAPSSTNIVVGTTAISGGTSGRVVYDNAGVVGEYTNTQLTALINAVTSSLPGSIPAFPNNTSTAFLGNGTYGQINLATGVTGLLPNANLAQAGAATIKGNPTGSTAAVSDFTIQGLVSRGAPDAVNDKMPIYDAAAGTIKYVTPGAIASSATAGVASINAATGALTTTNGIITSGTAIQPDYTHNNNFSGDQLFGSGRPWCDVRSKGAVGDGSTDDTAAINACITELTTLYGAGIIFFPPSAGAYCTFTGISITGFTLGDIKILGGGMRASALSVCGHNVTALNMNQQFGSVENMAIYGYGMTSTDTFNVTHVPTVLLGSGASYTSLRHLLIQGGSFPIESQCNGCRIVEVTAQYAYGDGSGLRAANAFVLNSGQYWLHNSFDQVLPTTPIPTFPTTVASWVASTAYAKGTVIGVACNGLNWWVQITTAGTSTTSQPACKNYLQSVTDGTAAWTLVGPNPFYAMQVDTGSNEVIVDSTDMTGFFSSCFGMTNTFAGTAPINVRVHNATPGGCYNQGYNIAAGANFKLEGGDVQGCIHSGCSGVLVGAGVSGGIISGIQFDNGGSFSVLVSNTSSNITMTGNIFTMGSTSAVSLTSGADYIAGIGNTCFGASVGLSGSPGSHGYFPTGTSGNPNC